MTPRGIFRVRRSKFERLRADYWGRRPCECAPGYRGAGEKSSLGDLVSVAGGGFNWSSAASGIYGSYLLSYVSNLNPSNSNARAYGFQLRCLSE